MHSGNDDDTGSEAHKLLRNTAAVEQLATASAENDHLDRAAAISINDCATSPIFIIRLSWDASIDPDQGSAPSARSGSPFIADSYSSGGTLWTYSISLT